LKSLTSIVEQMVAELLDPLESDGGMELVQDFAYPLPAIVIAELMGLPWEDRDRLKVWADDLALFIGGGTNPEEMAAAAQRSMVDMATYFEGWIEHRRREPSDDLISRLITVDEGGETLTDEEIWAQCLLLLTAGHQTTRDLISGGLWALFNHPEQLALLREDLAKVPSATEECLRYDSSVQMAGRMTVEPVEIGGQAIDAGQRVIMILGSANRDGNQFPEPDSFLIDRQSNRHVAFGAGPHHCLGGSLARLEGQVALRMMLERFPKLRPATDRPERKLNATFRRINRLPVVWS
jgi:cytochrome P450